MPETYNCKICGWQGLKWPHGGAVDCIQQYRLLVEELRGLLPQGKEMLRTVIARDVQARLWIEGEMTTESLERLITFIRFMQEAWTVDGVGLKATEDHK